VRTALAGNEWVVDHEIIKFMRVTDRPKLVRGDIAAIEKRTASLRTKATQIAKDMERLSAALREMVEDDIGGIASDAELAAYVVVGTIEDLQEHLGRLAEARDLVLRDTGRRANRTRTALAASVVTIWRHHGLGTTGEDREALEGLLAGIVETVEAAGRPIGQGQREWLRVLVDEAVLIPERE